MNFNATISAVVCSLCFLVRLECHQNVCDLAGLKHIMLLKLPIILSGNSFNFYLLFPKIIPNLLLQNLYKCATRTTISYL